MKKATMYTTVFHKDRIKKQVYETGLVPDAKSEESFVVNLYPQKRYQTIQGFGAALTESSGAVIAGMSREKQKEVIEAYYGKSGIGYTLGRIHMDSCDFSCGNYCAVNDPGDFEFQRMSLERDAKFVQPLVKMVNEALGEAVYLLLSPWSPPAFMKDTGARNGGGRLRKECYQAYADYVAQYLLKYKELGMPVSCMTVQNEPLAVQTWDSCQYTAEEEKVFLRDYLYPVLQEKGLGDIELYIWDHNKERVYERTCEILDDTTTDMIAGVAFHWYSGDHFETLQMVREDFPDLKLMHSEGCVELSGKEMDPDAGMRHARMYAHDIIGNLNHGMNSWYDWNLLLDERGGPNHVGNFCNAPVICNVKTGTVEKRPMFYVIEHFSRYIKPGAVRVGCSAFSPELEITAAHNPDGNCVLVMMNNSTEKKLVNLRVQGKVTKLNILGNSISTVVLQ